MKVTDHQFKLQGKNSISTKEPNSPSIFQIVKDQKTNSNFSKIKSKIIESKKQEEISNESPKHFQRNNLFRDKVDKSIVKQQIKNSNSIQHDFDLKFASPKKIEAILSHSRKKDILRQKTQQKQQGQISQSTNIRQPSTKKYNINYVQKRQLLQTQRKQQNKDKKYDKLTQRLPKSQTFLPQNQFQLNLNFNTLQKNNKPPSRCRSTVSKISVHNQNKQQVLTFTGIFNRNHQTQDTFYLYWKRKAHEYLDQNLKLSQQIKELKKANENQKIIGYQKEKEKLTKAIEYNNNCIDYEGEYSLKSFQNDLTKKLKYYQQELQKKICQIINLQEKIIELNQKIIGQKQKDLLLESLRQQLIIISQQNHQLKQRLILDQNKNLNFKQQAENKTNYLKKKNPQQKKIQNPYELPPKYRT